MPRISVIIPAYNAEKTIRETIDSVLNQSFTDFELIIVNDGSTDGTLAVIEQVQDPRIQVFSCPNQKVAASRNFGFAKSTGQYVSLIDADDLWTPDKLEAQYQALQAYPEAGLAYSWMHCIDEKSKFLRKCNPVRWSGDVLPQLLLDDFIGSGSNVMIRRDVYEQLGGFDASLSNAQDTDFWLRIAAHYPFALVPIPQVLYRILPQSMSSGVLTLETANLQVIERAFQSAPAEFQYIKPHAIANLYKYLSYKALNTYPGQQKTWTALRYLFTVLRTDPAMLTVPLLPKAFLKLAIMALCPPGVAQSLFAKFPQLANTSTFLGYEKTNLSELNP